MYVTDELVNNVLISMGVDVNKKKPPHWIQHWYVSKGVVESKTPNGFICSRCGKQSWSKKEICDGCSSVMVNSDKILNDLKEVDFEEVVRCKDCKESYPSKDGKLRCDKLYPSLDWVESDDFCSYGERRTDNDL